MRRSHPEFSYSRPYDPSVCTDVLLRREPEEEEDEEDDDKDDDKDEEDEDDDDEGYAVCPCLLHEGHLHGHLVTEKE